MLVSAEGFTVTWAVMLPQTAFTACQEKFLEPVVEGALLRGRKKEAQGSTKGLLINFYQSQCFAPDQIYSFTLLYFHSVFCSCLCGSEAGHGHTAYVGTPVKSPGWLLFFHVLVLIEFVVRLEEVILWRLGH